MVCFRFGLFGFEVVEDVTDAEHDVGIARTDTCVRRKVVGGACTCISCRVENIPECKRGRKFAVEQLLTGRKVEVAIRIFFALRGYHGTNQVGIKLQTSGAGNGKVVVYIDVVVVAVGITT